MKIYTYNSSNFAIHSQNQQEIYGVCSGAVCLWLRSRTQGIHITLPPDPIQATQYQQQFYDIATQRQEYVDASYFVAYKLHLLGLQTIEEFGTKNLYVLLEKVRANLGLYYLTLSISENELHAVGLEVINNQGYYLFDPDDGLHFMSFAHVRDYLLTEYEINRPSTLIKISGNGAN